MSATMLTLVRHGESLGNLAAAEARRRGAETIDVQTRDADTPLSQDGIDQARAWGQAMAEHSDHRPFDSVWCSPFRRAQDTVTIGLSTAGLTVEGRVDERLRDRDLGVLDALTSAGVAARHPDEAARRKWLGKFYHRPPGGESWVDVIGRVRELLRDLGDTESGRHTLVVCHDVVIMSIRYVLEGLSESSILQIADEDPVRNASITQLTRDGEGPWRLDCYNETRHLERLGAPVTRHPGNRHDEEQ